MQDPSEFRTNRDLFSNHYLNEHLRGSDPWQSVDQSTVQEAYDDIMELWERERDLVADRNESQLEDRFIRPMFRQLGIPYEVEETVQKGQRRPDYGFFQSEDAARGAFERRREGGDFYQNAVAVADAKYWDRKLDTRGERQRDFENPSYQIHVYLQETPTTWAVLTNGKHWRLYYGPTSHRLDSYYEIDLPAVLESGDLETFKYFYLFFRHEAFLPDASGDCFLDDVYDESNVFAQELGEDLQENIYDAITVLSEGFLQYSDNDLSKETLTEMGLIPEDHEDFERARLDLVHDSSLICLYRLIFVLYAESESRDLLETDNAIYEDSYSLNSLKETVADELDSASPKYQPWMDDLWSRLDGLFELIDQGSESRGIDPEVFYVPAYNGGLFRTDPDADDDREARFLARYEAGDSYVARVIELLTRSREGDGGGKIFVDYSSLDIRHLGSIYEGLLEYQVNVADESLTLDDGEYVPVGEGGDGGDVVIAEGEVYLTTDSGERKATGSYYTPEYVVEYIVENTLGPLVEEIRADLAGQSAFDEGGFAAEFAERVFDLKVLDPAMGSGHFLTSAVDYLAREIIDAQERQAEQQGVETVDQSHDINWARRKVAQKCIYGVDINPLAVELAKVSLWLRTLAAEQPLAFLDHHLKTGNSLVGSDIKDIDELEAEGGNGERPEAPLSDFGITVKGTRKQLMRIYQDFISIENRDLADVKEMERKYHEIERDDLRNRLVAMANVKTAEDFGLELPGNAYERMAGALDSDSEWANVEGTAWYRDARRYASASRYFHWKLEYPEVFYGTDGSDRENPSFDAVVGNPPYVPTENITTGQKKYLTSKFDILYRKYDLSVAFLEQGFRLVRESGYSGMITPVAWETGENYAKFRAERIASTEAALRQIINLPFDVFVDAYVDTNIAIFQVGERERDTFEVRQFEKRSRITDAASLGEDLEKIPYRYIREEPNSKIYFDSGHYKLLQSYEAEEFRKLGDLTDARQGIVKSFYEYSSNRESEDHLLYIECDVYRYSLTETEEKYIDFAGEDSLRTFYEEPRILVRRLVNRDDRLMAVFAEDKFVVKKDLNPFIKTNTDMSLRYILANLNSSLHSYLYVSSSALAQKDDFRQTTLAEIRSLPIRTLETTTDPSELILEKLSAIQNESVVVNQEVSSVVSDGIATEPGQRAIHDFISQLAIEIRKSNNQRNQLNLSLPDYLGNYTDDSTLGDRYQPPTGLAGSILSDTAADREKLKVENTTVTGEGSKLVLRATARYKPENPDAHETDQYGYTKTDPLPAMEFVGLSDTQRALIEVFVPYAVEEGGGFAGFRENATKNISLIDRLEVLTLPKLEDVADGLERYREAKARAEELDEKIAKTDELIDQIVYELYGLTDEEIEIVEEAVGDD